MQAEPTATERRFPCGQCGAKLEYAPGTKSLQCRYCGHDNPIAESTERVEEQDFDAMLRDLAGEADTVDAATIECDACGAETNRPPSVTSLACPFCGSNIVATGKTHRLIKPKALLPFKIKRETADASFRDWLKRRWFAPGTLKRLAGSDRPLTGMYVPYWTYDCATTSRYSGMRGDNYVVPETYTTIENGKPVTRTRMVTRVRWTPASGVVGNTFDDLLVIASRSLPRDVAAKLDPWDLNDLTPYADDYLSGFRAEAYQIDLAAGFADAKVQMQATIESSVRADIGGDHQQVHSLSTQYRDVRFKHVLLPIWISAYRHRNKLYQFLVNGRTGEVQGQRPYSAWKITGFVLTILALVGGVAWFIAQQN